MGQPVAVVHKPSSVPGVIRFEANRSLTGMGHERYPSRDAATAWFGPPIVTMMVPLYRRGLPL